MQIRAFQRPDSVAVIALWETCGLIRPWNDPHKDIERKLGEQPELFLVGERNGEIVATAMAGFDGHRGWVWYLAVTPSVQRQSLGRQLMQHIENVLETQGCPKVNLLVRSSNSDVIAFYRKLGYTIDEVVSLGKRLIPD